MTNAYRLSALEAARRIARRELSVEALVRDCLARIEAREAEVGAWVRIDGAGAIAAARALDAGSLRGPLHGIPVGVKDLIDTADLPTAYGSPIYENHRPAWDAACVAQARAAGALVLGKTVTAEFATYTAGKTHNPHRAGFTPGGSSSGSAAAVADFMVPLAYGTQTAGSIIRPAAYCGVVGFKPSFGAIPRAGVKSISESLDTVGVFARDVADVAFFAGVLATQDWSLPETGNAPRIGICRTASWAQALPESHQALEASIGRCAARGARVVEIDWRDEFLRLDAAQTEIMAYEVARALCFEAERHGGALSGKLREMIDAGRAIAPLRHAENIRLAERCRARLPQLFNDVDILLTLSAPGEAPAGLSSTGDPLFNRAWTLLGIPCLHLPFGQGPNGLPVGVQAVGRWGEDRRLLAAAAWVAQGLT